MTNMPNNPREGTVYEEVIVVSDDEESYIEEIIESDEYIEEFIEEVGIVLDNPIRYGLTCFIS